MKKMNRVLALVLSVCLLLSLVPATTAAEETVSTNDVTFTELENPGTELTKDSEDKLDTAELGYAAEDLVDVIVVLEEEALLDQGYSKKQIAKNGAELQAAKEKLTARQDALLQQIDAITDGEAALGYRYSVVITGFSVQIPYGKLSEIQRLEGVRAAFVAPTFSVPEDMTANSSSLDTDTYATSDSFGSALTWQNAGYTGAGMRIAILDTGLDTDHPSFAAAPVTNENSLTAEEVTAVLSELNAANNYATAYGIELTTEDVYYSEKIPFGFNYALTSLDVTHDNDLAGDHGTHVAGIAAANAVDTTDVVGVAPDAQVIVMKIFQPTGGAAFTDLVAAMEDCFRLDVDVMNMSLGIDAGFTTIGYEIWEEIFGKINENDMIAAVSAGNAYSAAYGNGYGTDKNLTSDPDNGIVSAPGTWAGATMVASSENDSTVNLYFTVGDSKIVYNDIAAIPMYTLAGTQQYVMVPGVGSEEDFASVDVSGKVAVVSRGEIDFTAKQTNAFYAGAIACIVYDNVEGELIYMMDAELLPNAFISKADAEIMAAATTDGVGTMTVMSSSDFIPVPNGMAGQMSDFSSWGVTPDLELAPEVTAPGGNIYSSVNNGEYGLMSGTSMAAPHVAGMAALVLQYLREQYPELTDAQLHTVAEALIMSTATPMMEYEGVEYSPRKQGSGLANVYDAVNSASYLTVDGSTPKASLGDNDSLSGSYSFSFELTNLSDAPKSYALDASVLTDFVDVTYASIGYLFMGETSLKLDSVPTFYIQEGSVDQVYDANQDGLCDLDDVQFLLDGIVGLETLPQSELFDLDQNGLLDTADAQLLYEMITSGMTESDIVVVEGGQTVSITVDVQLTESDMSYMNTYYPNGIYMDGFVRLYALDEGNSDLSLPFVGFYGDWSASPVLDCGWYYDEYLEYNRYPNVLWTSLGGDNSYLGANPYMQEDSYDITNNVVSPNGDGYLDNIDDMYISLMRSAKALEFTYTDTRSGEVLYQDTGLWVSKSYYLPSYDVCYPFVYSELFPSGYDFTDADGNYLPNNTHVTLTIDAYLDDGDELVDETVKVPITVDTQAPELLNVKKFHNVEGNEVELELTFKDNLSAAAVGLLSSDGVMLYALDAPQLMGIDIVDNSKIYVARYDVTGLGDKLMLVLADYAVNERYYGLNLNGEGSSYGDLVAFQYNYNTGVDGWVAFNEDVDAGETTVFVSETSFVAAEYVNGYIYAQTETGALYGFPYESMLNDTMLLDMTYITQLQNVYQDFAYSYAEGKLYGLYTYEDDGYPTSEVHSINLNGAYYDESLWMNVAPYEEVWMIGRGGVYGLTLAIDDAGTLYMLGTNYDWDTETVAGTAHLWTCALEENSWSGAMELGRFMDTGDTGLTMDYLQSMAWDHNTETLYWARFAPNGLNLDCQLLTVDPATAQCTQVGTLSGETCALIAPLTEESASQDAHTNVPEMDSETLATPILRSHSLTMNVGGTASLVCDFEPWYSAHKDLTWSSSDEAVATVDANGIVTAVGTGSAIITAANAEDETLADTCTVEVTALDLKLEGVISAQSAGLGNVTGTSTYEYTMVDGIPSFATVNSITAPEALNYGLSLATSVYGRGSIWACEYGNTGMIYEIDAETGVVKDALQPIDGDMLFGLAYSEELDTFTGIMNMYLYVDLPLTHEVEEEMLGSYDQEQHMFMWHRLNMLPYLLESNTGFTTNETGNGASSEIVFCGITVMDNEQNYYLSKDYMGNYSYYETTYTPTQTLVLLDNVGRLWYIDEITGMTKEESEWGDVTYMSADGMNMIAAALNGVEALEYVDEEGNSTYNVFVIREVAETPMTDLFRSGSMPRITYHFSDIAYAGNTAEGAPMFAVSMYDYWNNGNTNELYLYVPGVGTGEFTFDENWNYVELKTADRLYSLGNTGEYNIIASLHKVEVTGGVDPEIPEEGTEETTPVNYLTASVYTGK